MRNKSKSPKPYPGCGAVLMVLGFLLFLGLIAGGYYYFYSKDSPLDVSDMPVGLYFLPTEDDADCILLRQGETAVLIDAGEARDAENIVAFLKEKGVESISLMILTHPDKDHIGGAPEIIDNFEVARVVAPNYTKEHERYEALQKQLKEKGIPLLSPVLAGNYNVGEMTVHVYPPYEKHYNKDNNYSLATLITHGDVHMLFAGDAEQKRLLELMQIHWPKIDLLKVPRHGRASSSSGEFIELIAPEIAVITAADADSAVNNALGSVGATVYYTLNENALHFISDGKTLQLAL